MFIGRGFIALWVDILMTVQNIFFIPFQMCRSSWEKFYSDDKEKIQVPYQERGYS